MSWCVCLLWDLSEPGALSSLSLVESPQLTKNTAQGEQGPLSAQPSTSTLCYWNCGLYFKSGPLGTE